MRFFFALILIAFACKDHPMRVGSDMLTMDKKPPSSPNEAVATFGEGCFWHSEIIFQSLAGVRDAVSGYAGGIDEEPTYEKVSTGSTGHAECVQVYYDPSKISFSILVKAFFASHDPTTFNRQGNDVGSQYRSILFYRNAEEKKIIRDEIARLTSADVFKKPIVTEIEPFTKFYKAEEYHQEYIAKNPDDPYVKGVSIPEYLNFKMKFKDANFKPGQ